MSPQQTLDVVSRPDAGNRSGGHRILVRLLRPGTAARRARAVIREVLLWSGIDAGSIGDAESAVAELAANAEAYARCPYELRVVFDGGRPAWCEVVDGDPDLGGIPAVLDRLRTGGDEPALGLFGERGRGLLLVHLLSEGRCRAYPTRTCATGTSGKAVAFALPTETGPRPRSPVPDAGPPGRAGARHPTSPWAPALAGHLSFP
ncbi:hypothetical protein [Planomonospora sp. ID82291]|uniref:hypothetical protein n=1 Tax=Planomonospora sp. ID82291 TaxID=2738136 RepID=UPI0018C39F9B|nr:hypothetical protein [Planomonospora sp. ID82291]MBG0818672.1 hypothetical protein [Planomonospora sp. ID82291]